MFIPTLLPYYHAMERELLHPTPDGLYCPAGDFHVDPVRAVDRALITHGHSDHARPGHNRVLATRQTLDIMRLRIGENFCGQSQPVAFGESLTVNGVTVRFHPAGHVLGSAQIAIERGGRRTVVSGDYKRRADPTCTAFEPVACDVFITEATFGLPVFTHPETAGEIAKLLEARRQFPERTMFVGAYALGKAQRIIKELRDAGYDRPIYLHGAMQVLCDYYRSQDVDLGRLEPATVDGAVREQFAGEIVIAPPSALQEKWSRRFADPLPAFASGWMGVRQRAKQRGVELPLVISDHCDWPELTQTIRDVSPEEVWVTHGREDALVRWCELNDIPARPLSLVGYEEDEE